VTDRGNDLALVEAALFLSPRPLTRRAIAKILGDVQLAYVDRLLEDLAQVYAESIRGIELLIDDGRATLRVKHEYIERVAHLAPQQDIPRPTLRTLAVIAYNQPVTQAQVIRVRGNKGYAHIQELLERGLVRSEEHGRTLLLHVTSEFLRHFGLSSAEELKFHAPKIEDLLPDDASDDETAVEPEEVRESGSSTASPRSGDREGEASGETRDEREDFSGPRDDVAGESETVQSADPGGI
jgi:segregation and condensation protein B